MATLTAITDNIDTEDWAEDIINVYVAQQNAIFQYLIAGDIATGMVAPSLLNLWVNFGAPWLVAGYYKDTEGWVHTVGLVKSGTTTPNTNIFTYAAGYLPTGAIRGATASNGVFGEYSITAGGNFQIVTGGNTNFSLFVPPFKAA